MTKTSYTVRKFASGIRKQGLLCLRFYPLPLSCLENKLANKSAFSSDGIKLSVHGEFTDDTMVFQRGLCDTAQFPIEAFPKDTITSVAAMEFRGHGDSETGPVDDFSIRQFTDDTIALIEAKASRPVVIGGISMGSAVALRVAAKRPELIRALVECCQTNSNQCQFAAKTAYLSGTKLTPLGESGGAGQLEGVPAG